MKAEVSNKKGMLALSPLLVFLLLYLFLIYRIMIIAANAIVIINSTSIPPR